MTPSTQPVQVSGCVNFGGSLTVDTSLLPKYDANITLTTFNCSTGKFSHIDEIDSQYCSKTLNYHAHALVLDLHFEDCSKEGYIPLVWVLSISLGLVVVIVIGIVAFIIRRKYSKKEAKEVSFERW